MSELARIETVLHLQKVDLFTACDAEQIVRISGIARQRRFEPGDELYRANSPADALYCIVTGRVEIDNGSEDRKVIEPPGTLGVAEILSGRLRTDSATAVAETLALALDAEDFFDLLANNIEIVRSLFRQLLRDRQGAPQSS